jgi:hypothetical protein
MSIQAFAATDIWQPNTPSQTSTQPYTVHMNSTGVEKIAWKTFSSSYNPNFTGIWKAQCGGQYSYTFNADNIVQSLINHQPYYLHIQTENFGSVETDVTMGCRTKFPVAMKVKVPTNLGAKQQVTVEYDPGSCNGYAPCKATSFSQLIGSGNPNYLNGFANTFTSYDTETDANGYVTFTTWHGGDYIIYK